MSITELWAVIVVGENGEEDGIAQYPVSDEAMIALDVRQRDRIVSDAQRCNGVWQKSLRLARFEIKEKELI